MNRWSFLAFAVALTLCTVGCPPPSGSGGESGDPGYSVFVGGDGVCSPDFARLAEGAAEGSYIITPYVDDTGAPAIKAFSDAFNDRFNTRPDAWGALTYDAVGCMAKAIEASMDASGKPDRQRVRDALAAMKDAASGYSGVTGVTYFDENGDCKKPAIIATVKGGKMVTADLQVGEVKFPEVAEETDAGGEAKGEPILIGVAGPFTGPSQKYGEMIKAGASLMLDRINAHGGIKGHPLQVRWGDDEGNNSKAANVANDFAADPSLVAVVGHFNSTCSLAAKPVYKNAGIPALSPGSTNVDVCKGSDFYFRNLYRDDFQGSVVADFISRLLKKKKVVVFYDNDDYGTGLKDFFVKRAAESGLEVLEAIEYNRESTTDFTPLVTKAKYTGPEVIFVAGLYNEAALIAKACKKAGLTK